MARQVIIEGKNIRDIPSFYDELNRVFMEDVDWKLGQTLDGFNDLLYGGFGLIQGNEQVDLVWKDIASSKAALGNATTRDYYLQKLAPGSPFNKNMFRSKLSELEAGTGQTYFDVVLEIIRAHPNIHLIQK